MQGTDRVRVAAVGLGWVTRNRHIPWLQRCPAVDLVGVVDPTPAKVRDAMTHFHLRRGAAATGPADIEWLNEVDAVTIGTPPQTHHALATAYLMAGKHVLVEKPMALSPREATDLIRTAERVQKILAVVHNFQFASATKRLMALLRAGKLGELRGLAGIQLSNPCRRLPAWYEELPLGLFFDESPHLFYLVRSVLGEEPALLRAHVLPSRTGSRTPGLVDMLLTSGKIPVQITMNFDAPVSEWHLVVLGSQRLAVVDIFRDVLVVARNDGHHLGPQILRTSADVLMSHLAGVVRSGSRLLAGHLSYGNDTVIARFAEACRTGLPPQGISAQDGLRVVEMQHQVLTESDRLAA